MTSNNFGTLCPNFALAREICPNPRVDICALVRSQTSHYMRVPNDSHGFYADSNPNIDTLLSFCVFSYWKSISGHSVPKFAMPRTLQKTPEATFALPQASIKFRDTVPLPLISTPTTGLTSALHCQAKKSIKIFACCHAF